MFASARVLSGDKMTANGRGENTCNVNNKAVMGKPNSVWQSNIEGITGVLSARPNSGYNLLLAPFFTTRLDNIYGFS